jgi:hypothetical protein
MSRRLVDLNFDLDPIPATQASATGHRPPNGASEFRMCSQGPSKRSSPASLRAAVAELLVRHDASDRLVGPRP